MKERGDPEDRRDGPCLAPIVHVISGPGEREKDIWTDERRNGGGRCCVTGPWIVFPGDERAVYVILDLGREVSLCCVCGRMVSLILIEM